MDLEINHAAETQNPITTTRNGDIRSPLHKGQLEQDRLSPVEAVVEHGDARGRTMGFPTANMHLEEGYPLAFGVYAVRVGILRDSKVILWCDGVANFGVRPMYRIARPLLEAHLFGFDGDLYGMTLRVEFLAYLRPEAKFSSIAALADQIAADAEAARAFLSKLSGERY